MSSKQPGAGKSHHPLTAARRVVVKVGSALLVDARTGRLNRAWLETLVEDLLRLRRRGQQVILVSSGAIALGRRHLDLADGPLRLEESQAAAAVGQIRLAHAYKELLEAHRVTVAHVRLAAQDTASVQLAAASWWDRLRGIHLPPGRAGALQRSQRAGDQPQAKP